MIVYFLAESIVLVYGFYQGTKSIVKSLKDVWIRLRNNNNIVIDLVHNTVSNLVASRYLCIGFVCSDTLDD